MFKKKMVIQLFCGNSLSITINLTVTIYLSKLSKISNVLPKSTLLVENVIFTDQKCANLLKNNNNIHCNTYVPLLRMLKLKIVDIN